MVIDRFVHVSLTLGLPFSSWPLHYPVTGLYLQKTRQILSSIRNAPYADPGMTQGRAFTDQLNSAITTPTLRNMKGVVSSNLNENKELSGQLNATIGSPNLRSTGFSEKPL